MSWLALKVALPLDGAIVLSCSLVELYANPVPELEGGCACESYSCYSSVIELDLLANGERGGVHRRNRSLQRELLKFRIVQTCFQCCAVFSTLNEHLHVNTRA